MPDMIFVDSSNIEAIGYDSATRELHVRFLKSGDTYVYYEVEDWMFEDFQRADSKGVFFNTNIKDKYHFGKL
jgi:hypothetical protein